MLLNLEKSKKALALSEKESAWREMAQQVAHEIKNPLGGLRGAAQLLGLDQLLEPRDVELHRERRALARPRALAHGDPRLGGEVDGLGHVEAPVEARVVRARHRDHELARALHALHERDAVLRQDLGAQDRVLVAHVLLALDEPGGKVRLRERLEARARARGHAPPRRGPPPSKGDGPWPNHFHFATGGLARGAELGRV